VAWRYRGINVRQGRFAVAAPGRLAMASHAGQRPGDHEQEVRQPVDVVQRRPRHRLAGPVGQLRDQPLGAPAHGAGDVQGGGESVVAYEKWLKTKRRSVLESIVQYNQEDVRATAFLLDWLKMYAKEGAVYRPTYPWEGR